MSRHYTDDEDFERMLRKGIYPYDYINDYNRLLETSLPSKECFYSKLNEREISEKDYETAQIAFKEMKCNNLLDYHNNYLTCDVLLLSDIWSNFTKTCYEDYKLDPNYYITLPSLSWDGLLKVCCEEYSQDWSIELLTDMNMHLMFEKGNRGGLSQISKRYAKANHKYLPNYDPKEEDSYIMYYDANNLYGYAMMKKLPYKNFKWNTDTWDKEKILNIPDDVDKGYLFEVDLHYPDKLHQLHNGYALCSENKVIKNEMLNPFQAKDRKESRITKLVCSFEDKKEYVLNYRYLKQVLKLGLELRQVYRVIEYSQSDFMRNYIDKNTNKRKQAQNEFEKNFYKLMNNSVYGKTMENVRKRTHFKLLDSEESLLELRCLVKRFTYFNDNLVGVHLIPKEVKLEKPIFVGQNVLDESKILMYDFYYKFIMEKFKPDNVKLLMTDTDSLMLHIIKEDPYEVMMQNKNEFDLSMFPKDGPLYNPINKKIPGKFKLEEVDEEARDYIIEYCGLSSKLYSYLT